MTYPIKGFNPNTFIDWEGKLACVIYLPGCNFHCPFCHSSSLIFDSYKLPNVPLEHIEQFLKSKKGWIDSVVIGGGEPTLHNDLPQLIQELKRFPVSIKLDTNGTNPGMLRRLIADGLVDYVAMDVKAPLHTEKYEQVVAQQVDISRIKESIAILLTGGVDYEFRTTVVPGLLTRGDVINIARDLNGAKRYILQQFNPKDILDKELVKLKPYPAEELKKCAELVREFVKSSSVRGI